MGASTGDGAVRPDVQEVVGPPDTLPVKSFNRTP
jgi:hypothetical protein